MRFGGIKEFDLFELGNKEKIFFRFVVIKIFVGWEMMGFGNEIEV